MSELKFSPGVLIATYVIVTAMEKMERREEDNAKPHN